MKKSQEHHPPDLSLIRGELRVLNISVLMMIVFAALGLLSILRLVGVPGVQHSLLLSYRVLDALIVFSFLLFCRSSVRVQGFDLLLFIFAIYPFLIGLGHGNISITFINDTVIFMAFVIKIVVFRTILARISSVVDIDIVFSKPARKIVFWCSLIALMSLGTVSVLLRSGAQFYYQAPAELTFAAAIVLAQGKMLIYLVMLALALLAGKRMIMIGLLAMGLVAIIAHPKMRSSTLRFALVVLPLLPFVIVGGEALLSTEAKFVEKIMITYRQFERSSGLSGGFLEKLMYIDPARYGEYISLQPHLTGWSLWFGNGYGFRYELDAGFFSEFGYTVQGDVTNAHFTPLAIIAKFGLVGLGIWFALIASVLTMNIDRHSFVHNACRLAFISMIVQSFFAFGFFINMFTPFYIAMATLGRRKTTSGQHKLAIATSRLDN